MRLAVGECEETLATLAIAGLARSGTQCWVEAISRLGSAVALIGASDKALAGAGLTAKGIARLRAAAVHERAARLRDDCRQRGIGIACYRSEAYPALLRHVPDAPLVLYWRGAVAPAAVVPAVAIVGARRATRYGLRCAREFGAAVAGAGAWVVSGLAHGIDAAAQAPSAERGRSAAVLAGGVDRCYPATNRRLAEKVVATGVILSEYPPGTPTLPRQFPVRNRIITGMAKITLVVEAEVRSGSLVSARHAADQGRDVMAVPGPIDSPASFGTNRLIADGCRPALEPLELLEAIGLAPPPGAGALSKKTARFHPGPPGGPEAAIFQALDADPRSADDLVLATGLDESVVLEKLTSLELDGLAERLPSGAYVRCARRSGATEHS